MKQLADIDYAPLAAMDAAHGKIIRETFKLPVAAFYCLAAFICFLIGIFLAVEAAFIVFVICMSIIATKMAAYKNVVWKNFAAANDWYIVTTTPSNYRFVPPALIGVGHGGRLGAIVHAQFEGHECDMYMYEFTTGSGKNSQTHYYTVARVLLSKNFPHLILDSKKSWAIREHGSAKQRVKLEGDFDQCFSLYHVPNEQISALSIITPDIMQTLIDSNSAQDIEIADNYLFFMIHSDKRSAAEMPAILKSVDDLADEIAHKAKTLRHTPLNGDLQNAETLAAAHRAYFKSTAGVGNWLWLVVIFFIFLPIIMLVVLGAFNSTVAK